MFSLNTGKYGPEKNPYLGIFCAVREERLNSITPGVHIMVKQTLKILLQDLQLLCDYF